MTRAIKPSAFAVVALAAAQIACAELARAQQEPGFLDRVFGERAAPAAGQQRVAQVPSQELIVRLERLEAHIRQLTGAIEQLQYRNQQLEGQVRRLQEDTEFRFQELGAKGAPRPATQGRPQSAPPAAATAPGKRGDAFDPTQNPNAPGVPRPLGTTIGADAPPVGAPGGRSMGAPLDLATLAPAPGIVTGDQPHVPARNPNVPTAVAATPPAALTPKDELDFAYSHLVRKEYAAAEDSLRAFLQNHPNDRLASEATYWLGESLFQRQRYRDAAEAFLNVSTKYESSAKAPDALFRLGQSLAALGETEAACASLGEVLRKFPRTSASMKHAVEREQKRVRC
jgi:tol-pal system protein YbgF